MLTSSLLLTDKIVNNAMKLLETLTSTGMKKKD